MSWFADLAGKAENLLNNIDEQTGAALRNHAKTKKNDFYLFSENTLPQKKRPMARTAKKSFSDVKPKLSPSDVKPSLLPSRKSSPQYQFQHNKESENHTRESPRRSPIRRTTQLCTTMNSPKISSADIKSGDIGKESNGLRRRRSSFPEDLTSVKKGYIYKMQNLEVENAMLKNELNVMSREITETLDRLRKTEDELGESKDQIDLIELMYQETKVENELLTSELNQLKQKVQELDSKDGNNKEQQQELEREVNLLITTNSQLEEKLNFTNEELNKKETAFTKLENELRHAQALISEKQGNLEKSTAECHRLEKEWESYKLRVKSMLFTKDEELKKLREGTNLTEDTKLLMEQIETLKNEREELTDAISRVRGECEGMKKSMAEVEAQFTSSERVIVALRDALKEERTARNKAEMQCIALGKELKAVHFEMGQTVANLRVSLQEKEQEISQLRETSTALTSDTSALNVADYDVMQVAMDNEKIQYLTQTLVQKQGKIESLMSDNNILRIQLEKLQIKHRSELASVRNNYTHSVVQVQDGDVRSRTRFTQYSPSTSLSKFSVRIGVLFRRYPLLRMFIIFYMIGLHFWVLTVLFTSTPEDIVSRPIKT